MNGAAADGFLREVEQGFLDVGGDQREGSDLGHAGVCDVVDGVVIPFDTLAYKVKVDASDSIPSLSARLSKCGGRGTARSLSFRCAHEWDGANTRFAKQAFGSNGASSW